ncbi:MAG: YciI family protein [Gemmatimonadales bacterium]
MHDDERQAPLGHLRQEVAPPPALETALGRRLLAAGFARTPRPPRPRWFPLLAGAAALALVAFGLLLGRQSRRPAAASAETRYALLLYDPVTFDTSIPERQLVEEYRRWAESLGAQLDGGEKLAAEEVLLPGTAQVVQVEAAGPRGVFGGYFVVRAPTLDAAIAIARSCPHLRHGGTIAVRRIEAT